MVSRARPKFCPDNSSIMAEWIELKFQAMFLRVPSFVSDKKFDHTWSLGHGPKGAAKILSGYFLLNYWMERLQIFKFVCFFPSVCTSVKNIENFVWRARPKCFLDNSSIMAAWIRLKI